MKDRQFENDVKTYGTQTGTAVSTDAGQFENDVKTYGTQTMIALETARAGLRMM